MAITSEMIKKLRDKTGAGMMDCKRALESTNGDMEAAIEYLRKKGAAVAAKRADRAAKEGMVATRVSADGKTGVIVEVNCETDFVGRSDDFTGFVETVATAVEKHTPATLEALAALPTESGKKISELLNDLLAKVGEKLEIRRFTVLKAGQGLIASYTHLGSKIGVLVELTGVQSSELVSGTGRDVAMQIAAMNPLVINRDQVDKTQVERELDIYRTQARNEKKPEPIVEKIALGRLEKYYQEVCLIEQTFIKDPGKTIRDYLGANAAVVRFVRYHLGEENQ